jgi:TetR/AcrR family fatty acid metabolism transcriptional regulator
VTSKRATKKQVKQPRDLGRRQRILDVAKRHFAFHGYKGANLDAIARDAGCAKGALYLEFADKQALLNEVVSIAYHASMARYRAEVAKIASPIERIAAALRFSYREIDREPALVRIAKESPEIIHELPAEMRDEAQMQIDVILRWLAEAKAKGELREGVDELVVPWVIALLKYAPMNLDNFKGFASVPVERTLDAVIDIFLAGISARPSSKARRRGGS